MNENFQKLKDWHNELKQKSDENQSLWNDISKVVGITVNPKGKKSKGMSKEGDVLDSEVNDPTAALSVNQAGDYLLGIMWGTGEKVLEMVPTDEILQIVDQASVAPFYKFTTNSLLNQMNNAEAGLSTNLKPYVYDQVSFGTSGIGVYPNENFGVESNALIYRSYGVDNIDIDEGKSGLIDVIFVTYQWRVNRIISEFCYKGGIFDEELFNKMPEKIQKDYTNKNINEEYTIIQAIFPREDFDPKLQGKRGARYQGVWYMSDDSGTVLLEEDYPTIPVAVARAIKVRGQVWGRSSGTLLISTIKAVNYIVGETIKILEKMEDPSIGIWNNAIFGDSVVDTSPGGLVVFNEGVGNPQKNPVFPLHEVGDPTGIIKYLIPYLNEKITTGFKVDLLLDFNSAKDMTATESLQRFVIRGKSLSSLMQQQKVEMLEPMTHRSVSLCDRAGLMGVDPAIDEVGAKELKAIDRGDVIIPDAVLEMKKAGKPWYKIKFNNELDKLSRTEAIENILQVINLVSGIAALYPIIVQAIDWFKLVQDLNSYLCLDYVIDADAFKEIVLADAQAKAQAMEAQVGKDMASAGKDIVDSQLKVGEAKQGGGDGK